VLADAGCRDPVLGFRHFQLHFQAKVSDPRTWTDRWDLKLERWALDHERMGCPCEGKRDRKAKQTEPEYDTSAVERLEAKRRARSTSRANDPSGTDS
jgi:hypothetical protein